MTNFKLGRYYFPWYLLYMFNFVQKLYYFFSLLAANFLLASKSWPTFSAAACPPFSNLPTIDRPQISTKNLIYAEESLNFWIIIKRFRYRSISLLSNIIYIIFVVERSYKYQRQNVSNTFWSFGIYVISCTVLVVNKYVHPTKHLFLLHSICHM